MAANCAAVTWVCSVHQGEKGLQMINDDGADENDDGDDGTFLPSFLCFDLK